MVMEFDSGRTQRWIERRDFKCPGCGLDDEWAFDRAGVVVTLPERSLRGGVMGTVRSTGFVGGDVQKAMRKIIEDLQEASRKTANQVVKLPFGNCGYVLFLDANKAKP
jgi:hypothetical protein